jgi:hypothetical protein
MDFKEIFETVKEIFLNHPAVIILGVAGFCIALLIMLDAQKCKKMRDRRRHHRHHHDRGE